MSKQQEKWTVMIYFAGDNNLAEEMIWAVKDIQSWWLDRPENERGLVNVVAMFDAGGPPLIVDFDDFTPPQLPAIKGVYPINFESTLKRRKFVLEQREVELGSEMILNADAARKKEDKAVKTIEDTLYDFISRNIEKHSSKYLMLVLSGHGSGAIGDFLTGDKRASGLTIRSLGSVGRRIKEDYGKQIDVLGLDSCQMSMAEVMFEVQDWATIMIGAEGFTPNTGWPYEKVLSLLPTKPPVFAQNVVRKYIEYYLPYTTADVSTDISAINLEEVSGLQSGIEAFTTALKIPKSLGIEKITMEDRSKRLKELLDQTELKGELLDHIVLARREAQGYKREQYVDLWDFCFCLKNRLKPDKSIAELKNAKRNKPKNAKPKTPKYDALIVACDGIMNAIDPDKQQGKGIVLLSGYCGARFQHSNGLSIYFPWASFTDAVGIGDLDHYQRLRFAKDSPWNEFLRLFLFATKREVRSRNADQTVLHSSLLNRLTGFFTDGPGKDGQVSTGDKDGQVSTGDKSQLGIVKIESMKNPPTDWHESNVVPPRGKPKTIPKKPRTAGKPQKGGKPKK